MVNKKDEQREQHRISVGPLMKKILDIQRENVKEVTKDVCDTSNWEAGEIIAKKVIEEKLV